MLETQMVEVLGLKITARIDNLGSHINISSNLRKKEKGQELIQKLSKKFQGWKAKILSQAGRLTLCRSVLQSIPIYQVITTKLLKKDLDHIMKLIIQFWWGDIINVLVTDHLTRPLCEGGLGHKNLGSFNEALLTTQL